MHTPVSHRCWHLLKLIIKVIKNPSLTGLATKTMSFLRKVKNVSRLETDRFKPIFPRWHPVLA